MLRNLRQRLAVDHAVGGVVNDLHDGIAVRNDVGELLVWNRAAIDLTGWSAAHAAEHFAPPSHGLTEVGAARWVSCRTVNVTKFGCRLTITLFSDASQTVALREAYARLDGLATTDGVTGLPNRQAALQRLNQSLSLAHSDHRDVAVLILDVDRFRLVNESLGFAVGDQVLEAIAGRLRRVVSEGDTVARCAGDEFMVILHQVAGEQAELMAKAVAAAIREPIAVGTHEVWLTGSVGAAMRTDGADAADLLAVSQRALARCKTDGGNGYRLATRTPGDGIDQLSLAADLHRAVHDEHLALHYQPQINADTGGVVGVEALVRWDHPRLGMLGPDRFLPISYEDGLILDIDAWVVRQACQQAAEWLRAGFDFGIMGVNVSARTMCSGDVVDIVNRALAASGISPERLEIEVSEHVMASNSAAAETELRALRELGVLVAIDDFGTGYSSLAHLKRFPLDTIKLDRGFVADIADQPSAADVAILRSVVNLAHDLGLRCVAEGVETTSQRRLLRYLQCHVMQGHLYGKAVPPSALESMMRSPLTV
ncbi:MAG: putative bifunctional diguanylate cyclase/phosphodiesterase [Acidimicrobiales bacterium]